MIIEGFEIENWTCIKKLTVAGLPSKGVIVLHGPNRTGKSSVVQALRACLMDYSSKSTALKSVYPRGKGERPKVSVTYSSGGTTYRTTKCYGSDKSELASRTSTGAWRVEANTAPEAHAKVCDHAGGDDSSKGLRQLLWLTQAEFRLPDPKKFDPDVQAQLRGILGVLQTTLDDRFINRVKTHWNVWHGGQRKAGKRPAVKEGCNLAVNLARLVDVQRELNESEIEFNEIERLLQQTSDLEARRSDLNGQIVTQKLELQRREVERERSQARIAARKIAEERYSRALQELQNSLEEQRQRSEAVSRLTEATSSLGPATQKVDSLKHTVQSLEAKQTLLKTDLVEQRERRRVLKERAELVSQSLGLVDDLDKLEIARQELERAELVASDIDAITRFLAENPVPDGPVFAAMKTTHETILKLRANFDAASMTLKIETFDGASAAQLSLDGKPLGKSPLKPLANSYSVRRKAELIIPNWGRMEFYRGAGTDDFDQIEEDLRRCREELKIALAGIGIDPTASDAFDQLLQRNAEHGLRVEERRKREGDLKSLAPKGLDTIRRKILELEAKLKGSGAPGPDNGDPLPSDRNELQNLKADFDRDMAVLDHKISSLEQEIETGEIRLGQYRPRVTQAKEVLAGCEASVTIRKEELERLRTEDQAAQRVETAKRDITSLEDELRSTELTSEESTVVERVTACKEGISALERQARENEEKYNRIKGRLEGSEGLHAQRALSAARVDELTRVTSRETLERDATDRLYELFEECREKQLGTLMGPIHDRILNWMRVLDIGDYKEIRFGDTFLPDKLVKRDGTAEFLIGEESTGAQEQIGMLVRLALGSLLTRDDEPTGAIFDDPLTHCDVGRLNRMRVILRRSSEGHPKQRPSAGPLQIMVFTCHPEWFRDEHATVIDLENPEVMQRYSV